MRILIEHGILITMDPNRRVIPDGAVAIEGDRIAAVGTTESVRKVFKPDRVIDAKKKAVIPGLVSTHTHSYLSLMRGLSDDMSLDEWVSKKCGPLEYSIIGEPGDCYNASMLSNAEFLKAGVTCYADMGINMGQAALAAKEAGIRVSLCPLSIDRGHLPFSTDEVLRQNTSLIEEWHGKFDGRVTCMFGLCTLRITSRELMLKGRDLSKKYGVGIHLHVSEVKRDIEYTEAEYGKRPVEYLEEIGLVGPTTLLAHCVWLDDNEINILGKTHTSVSHNPTCNAKLASGIAPVPKMLRRGVNVSLGADGGSVNNALDVFREMLMAATIHKANTLDPTVVSAEKAMEMATINGARALGLENQIGSIEAGKKADIALVNLDQPHLTPLTTGSRSNVVSLLVYGASGRDVDTTIVNGQVLLHERKFTKLDEREVINRFSNSVESIVKRLHWDA